MTWIEDAASDYILPIAIAYGLAWLVHRIADRLAERFIDISDIAPVGPRLRQGRHRTLTDLLGSVISFSAFLIATLFALARFIDTTTLIWMVGLFSAAFGFGARPLISDLLTGLTFIFEDAYDVGEKVEVVGVEGVIERIRLRTTLIRSPNGELFVVPNGEVRVIRNFSRGRFSTSNITIKIAASDLPTVLPLLNDMAQEAVARVPHLIEPWQVISPEGIMGHEVELTLLVKTVFGKAAETRPQLLSLIQERLAQVNITLAS